MTQSHNDQYGYEEEAVPQVEETTSHVKTPNYNETSQAEDEYKTAATQRPTRGGSRFGGPANVDTRSST